MMDIMQSEQLKGFCTYYLLFKPHYRAVDFTYKAGGGNVTITADKRDNGKITAGD